MTKKHFQELANTMAAIKRNSKFTKKEWALIMGYICRFCYEQTSRFNEGRFIEWVEKEASK